MSTAKLKMLINESDYLSSVHCKELLSKVDIESDLCFTDGIGLFDRLSSAEYDLVLTDVFVPEIDAIMLKKLYDSKINRPLKFYGVLPANNKIIEASMINADFSYYFVKPRSETVIVSTIFEQLSREGYGVSPFDSNDEIIYSILRNLNISAEHLGFHYAYYAILLFMQQTDVSLSITKIIYPKIAKEYKTTTGLVEKTIRSAIEAGWSHANPLYQNKYFGYCNKDNKKRPTNLQFISTLANNVMLQNIRVEKLNLAIN